MNKIALKKVEEFDIESNTIKCDVSYRGGIIKVDVSSLFSDYDEDLIMGASQNYLGGGMLGAISGGSMFEPKKEDEELFNQLSEKIKMYFHELTNHEDDEWESQSYEVNQSMPVSAY